MLNFRKPNKFIVITEHECFVGKTEEDVNTQAGGLIEKVEYKRIGDYYVSILNPSDLSFVQDKRRMSNIPWRSLGKESKTQQFLLYGILALQFVSLITGGG